MRKFLVLLALAAMACFVATSAFAGILNSRHDMVDTDNPYTTFNFKSWGACSPCHVPHGAVGDRLFPTSIAGTAGFIGNLCLTCHDTSINNSNDTAVNDTVLDNAHGLTISDITNMGSDNNVAASTLPYCDGSGPTGTDAIECTSCHEIHNQTGFAPFLQLTLDDLCERCHTQRVNNSTGTTGFSNSISTHPAGSTFTDDISGIASGGAGGDSPITLPAILSNDAGDSDWARGSVWDSGVHLSSQGAAGTGGVDCITCHTVHWDEDDATPYNGTSYLGFIADNTGGDNNAFCEGCHQGSTTGSAGTYYWNPGATDYSHPCDDVAAQDDNVTAELSWQPATSSSLDGTGDSGLVCTSCHGVHRQDSGTPQTEANTPILLQFPGTSTTSTVCAACHAYAQIGFNHHPVGASYATNGNDTQGLTCAGAINGVGQCHNSAGTNGSQAHNLNSVLGEPTTEVGGETSGTCVVCHTDNPSTYTPTGRAYVANGLASHFVGDVTGETFDRTTECGTDGIRFAETGCSDGAESVTWTGSGLPSRFGSTVSIIVCESCHRLAYGNIDGGNGSTACMAEESGATSAVGDPPYDYGTNPNLCAGCHLIPSGTHPLGAANGAVYTLPSPANGFSYVSSGGPMNCESCHSAHDAQTFSGSFILNGSAGTGSGSTGMEVEPTIDYTGYCAECHGAFD